MITARDASRYNALEQRLGYQFRDPRLCETALTHKSWLNERADDGRADNERLEFLGDAVIALVVSDLLMRQFPTTPRESCPRSARRWSTRPGWPAWPEELSLGQWIFLGRGEEQAGGRQKRSILADALEALVGAVYRDGGFEAAYLVAERLFASELAQASARRPSATSSRGCRRSRRPACTWPRPTRWSPRRAPTTTRPSRWPSSWEARSTGGRTASRRRRPSRTPPPAPSTPSRSAGDDGLGYTLSFPAPSWPRSSDALIPADVIALCRRLREAGHEAHLVGGGVRDLVLGRPPKDFDVATSATPETVMGIFGQRFAIPTGLQHGTVTVLTGHPPAGRPIEVTTFRGEGIYLDGRRPSSVQFGKTLTEDLGRRDFTMNAIAYDPLAAKLTDPFGGQKDIRAALVRAVGDPIQRFREDGLRPMRAVRQATQLGFTIDPATLRAIPAAAGLVPQGLGRANPRRAAQDPGRAPIRPAGSS